jgi:cobalt-zinc-cadmium efflux system protein
VQRSQSVLAWSLALTLGFAIVEVVTGFMSNSLALISDAGHMVTDAAALGLALLAQLIAKRPPSAPLVRLWPRGSAGSVCQQPGADGAGDWIAYEAISRFSPEQVHGAPYLLWPASAW